MRGFQSFGPMLVVMAIAATGGVFAQPSFTDVTVSAGVNYVQHIPQVAPNCIFGVACEQERMTGGAAVGDVDNDGDLDLFVTVLDGPDILFLNNDDGTFQPATSSGLEVPGIQSNGAAFGDVDNDGDLDLYVTTLGLTGDALNTRTHLYINDGSGSFTEEGVARGAAIDNGQSHQCWSVVLGDYDRDGWLDIHVTEWAFNGINARLLRGLGSSSPGYFIDNTVDAEADMTGVFGFAGSFSDVDGDDVPELLIAGDYGTSKLYSISGGRLTDDTALSNTGTDENGMGSTVGDFDNDGDLDWFVTSIHDAAATCDTLPCNWGYSGNRLYRNEGGRVFSDVTDQVGVREGYWGWGAAFFDYDNDGDLDLTMTNGVDFPGSTNDDAFNNDPMRMWENQPDGTMAEVSGAVGLTDTGSGKGLLVFDYDDDGDLDLFIVNNGSTPRLYRNDGGNAGDWLRVRVVGSGSNRDGIGAQITAQRTPGGPVQVHEIGSTTHFLAQSERVAHFGLGTGTEPLASVLVRWPGGKTARLTSVARNSTVVVDEANCIDTDGDDHCLGADCDETNPDRYFGAEEVNDGIDNQCPGEPGAGVVDDLSGVGFYNPSNRDEHCWNPQVGATQYESLRSTSVTFDAGCVTDIGVDTCWIDGGIPSAGQLFYYIDRALTPFAGSWGARSDMTERTPTCL